MTTRDFTANVISASKVVPDGNFKDSKASGVWDINEALDLIKGGNWPNAANFNPSAFVDGLFSVDVYDGNSSTQTITNGIDLSSKGGLVWIKRRDGNLNHGLFDTERGAGVLLQSNVALNEYGTSSPGDDLTSFNSDGFTLGDGQFTSLNYNSYDYVSWTFREQPKFFDIVAYDGTGSARTISHNLGSVPGMIIIKHRNGSSDWHVYHRGTDSSAPEDYITHINTNDARSDEDIFNDTAPTSSVFSVNDNIKVNGGGGNKYVAYLFAHNNDDGGFGEPGDQDIIKCDSFTNSGSTVSVNLGFEPQFIMFKNSSGGGSWFVADSMRGIISGSTDPYVTWDGNGGDANLNAYTLTPTGFDIDGSVLGNGDYIYMAIRRGGMQTPTAASDVFAVDSLGSTGDGAAPAFKSPFVADMGLRVDIGEAYTEIGARLTQDKWLYTNLSNAEANASSSDWDYTNGWYTSTSTASNYHGLMWARARGYFDVVTYTGTGSATTISHNLGVAPEMIWLKSRDSSENWQVGADVLTGTWGRIVYLNRNNAESASNAVYWNNTAPTSSVFSIGTQDMNNKSGDKYIAYLFATVAGVSKVGSFTQSGATNVDCGFTGSTPALIILKRTDSTGDWYIFDSLRGIIAGNDPYKVLNEQTAGVTNSDVVDPYSSGFATTSTLTNGDYIFYAIAAIS